MIASTQTTVVVITFNYAHYLTEAVESVLAQTRRPQLLVMDDASEDDTPAVMERLMTRAGLDARYVRAASNQGLSRTRNAAAGMVATEWLVYLDADDWLAPNYVEHGEEWLATHRELDALTTDMEIVRNGRRHRRFISSVPASWPKLLKANSIVQTSFIRTSVVRALGGYDPGLDFEDWDFWIRALKGGYRIGRLQGAHVFRREHGSNKSKLCDEPRATRQIRDKHGR